MSVDPPKAHMEERLLESANVQPMTVGCLLCDWPGVTGPAGQVRVAAQKHRDECHPELAGKKPVVRKKRVFSQAMTQEREEQINEERRQRMRTLGIS